MSLIFVSLIFGPGSTYVRGQRSGRLSADSSDHERDSIKERLLQRWAANLSTGVFAIDDSCYERKMFAKRLEHSVRPLGEEEENRNLLTLDPDDSALCMFNPPHCGSLITETTPINRLPEEYLQLPNPKS